MLLPFHILPASSLWFVATLLHMHCYQCEPVKSCQMSIKVAQKLFNEKNERFQHLYKNGIKCGQFWLNNCCHRLLKVDQSVINCPIWSHCT